MACGQHAIVVVKIKNLNDYRRQNGKDKTDMMVESFESFLTAYALEDTIIAKHSEGVYVVILHYLTSRSEIMEICEEIKDSVEENMSNFDMPIELEIGAAECHHDPDEGYKCAAVLAMEALAKAEKEGHIVLAPDTLRMHPLAEALKMKH